MRTMTSTTATPTATSAGMRQPERRPKREEAVMDASFPVRALRQSPSVGVERGAWGYVASRDSRRLDQGFRDSGPAHELSPRGPDLPGARRGAGRRPADHPPPRLPRRRRDVGPDHATAHRDGPPRARARPAGLLAAGPAAGGVAVPRRGAGRRRARAG